MSFQFNRSIVQRCRELRKDQTEAEAILWKHLRGRKFHGYKFFRQHPIIYDRFNKEHIGFFIADFYCAEKRIIIELDGKIHDHQKEYDQQRDEIIQAKGIRVIRFKNEEVNNINILLSKILAAIT